MIKQNIFTAIAVMFLIVLLTGCGEKVLKQRPQTEPPVIETLPTITDITYSSAIVSWVTDVPCSTVLKYWINGNSDTLYVTDSEYRQVHETILDSLTAESDYEFRVKCVNQFDNFSESVHQTFSTLIDYSGFIAAGWDDFEMGNYTAALIKFTDYLTYNSDEFRALLGAAWSSCRTRDLNSAIDYFVECLADSVGQIDAVSGITLAAYQKSYYSDVIHYGSNIQNQVLNFWADTDLIGYNPADSLYYEFQHDDSYNNLDIALMLSDSYFQIGNNSSAKGAVDFLLPMNGMHENDTSSWSVNSVNYDTYTSALGALIDSLKNDYWQNGENP